MMIEVRANLTASNTDALAGTQLDQVPTPGRFTIWLASSVSDSTVTVSLGQDTIINAQPVSTATNGVPLIDRDPPVAEIDSPGGVRPIINVVEVTAMVANLICIFEF